MKEGIHPNVKKTTISCVCGAEFELLGAKEGVKTEICSNCHPFYTGKTKRVAVGGRVEKFNKKYNMEK